MSQQSNNQAAANLRAMITPETCANCGRQIGNLETPHIYQDSVVCTSCGQLLAAAATPQVPSPPVGAIPYAGRIPQPTFQQFNYHSPQHKKIGALSIVSIVFASIALLISWIPLAGAIGIPVAALAILLGGIGAIVAAVAQDTRVLPAIAGVFLALLAILIQVAITRMAANSLSAAIQQAQQQQNATTVMPGVPGQQKQQQIIRSVPVAPVEWINAGSPIKCGDVTVSVNEVLIEKVRLLEFGGNPIRTDEDYLSVSITVRNSNRSLAYEYRTWSKEGLREPRLDASLRDAAGKTYKLVDFGISEVVGSVRSQTLGPLKVVNDQVIFERPRARVDTLYLELPAKNFGGEGTVKVKIPYGMIRASK